MVQNVSFKYSDNTVSTLPITAWTQLSPVVSQSHSSVDVSCSRTFIKTWSLVLTWTPEWLWWGPMGQGSLRYWSCWWERLVQNTSPGSCNNFLFSECQYLIFFLFVAPSLRRHDPQTFSRQDWQISSGKYTWALQWTSSSESWHHSMSHLEKFLWSSTYTQIDCFPRFCLSLQHLTEQLELDLSPLEYMMKCYPAIKEKEEMRKIIGRYGLTGKQQVGIGFSTWYPIPKVWLYSLAF